MRYTDTWVTKTQICETRARFVAYEFLIKYEMVDYISRSVHKLVLNWENRDQRLDEGIR